MPTPFDRRIERDLSELARQGLARRIPRISRRAGMHYEVDGHPAVSFCSNDYLGLSAHPELCALPTTARPGSTASPLVCGDSEHHRAFEHALADFSGTEDAVLFPSGYQLNVGVIPCLLDARDHVHSDRLNHASLVDGLRLSKAKREILGHGDIPQVPPASQTTHWWVTESIFSMDGDRVPLPGLRDFMDAGGHTYIDEAHGVGLFTDGQAYTTAAGISPTVTVGTLGKALGCAGAYVAASAQICRWIRSRARSFVYSTGVSPSLVERLSVSLRLVRGDEGTRAREQLWANVRRLARRLDRPVPGSAIFPVHIGDNRRAVAVSEALLGRGWHVQAIRPPTVPTGTARLRVTVTALHDPREIDAFATDLQAVRSLDLEPDHEVSES